MCAVFKLSDFHDELFKRGHIGRDLFICEPLLIGTGMEAPTRRNRLLEPA